MRRFFPALLTFFCFCCADQGTPPPEQVPSIQLSVEDASCTEAWLRATTREIPITIALVRDNHRVQTLRLTTSDSLFIDEGLLPHRTYDYRLQKLGADSSVNETTGTLHVTTMDTTSHSWSFQVDTLGDGNSRLYNVAIINDTLAYAVGEMYLRDSTGQIDPQAWNAAKWNGRGWEIKRIPFIGPCSAVLYPPLRATTAFSATDILVTNGGSIVRYDGTNSTMDCGMNTLLAGAINKIWASTPQDIYAVGNGGTIVHYNGNTWQRIESGTTLPIRDIYGARDALTGEYEILCVAEAYAIPGGSKILAIENGNVHEVPTNDLLSWDVLGLRFIPGRQYIVVGDGVWRAHSREGSWRQVETLPSLFSESVSGRQLNDIVVCGAFWLLAHYNGASWQTYFPRISGPLGSLDIKGDFLVAVGSIGDRAVAVRGRR